MQFRSLSMLTILCSIALAPSFAFATLQEPEKVDQGAPASQQGTMPQIDWQRGPVKAQLGSLAEIDLPAGLAFADRDGARKFLEATHNLASGNELGVVLPTTEEDSWKWSVYFEWDDSGYVKDDDRDEIDADELLASLKEGQEQGNERRRQRGWSDLELVGWKQPPFYDPKTNNLTWATLIKAKDSPILSVNWSTRLLGRRGHMRVDLVLTEDALPATIPKFDALIAGFNYVDGQRYAEYEKGDKVAQYGLAALVTGGAAVVALKSGFLAKFWKFILIGLVAAGAFLKRGWNWITGRSDASHDERPNDAG